MRILVTGGCGFIGSNFVQLALEKLSDCRLINLDKLTYAGNPANLAGVEKDPRYRFVQGDICDAELIPKIFSEEEIDTVVHFAAESHVDRTIPGPAKFIQTNVLGTFTLLEAARIGRLGRPRPDSFQPPLPACLHRRSLRLSGGNGPFHRKHLLRPPFALFSQQGRLGPFGERLAPYLWTAGPDHQLLQQLRPLSISGKTHPADYRQRLRGKELPVYGDGKNVRDWLYVGDHCEAILKVLENGRVGETYNIGGNSEKQNIEVVRTICDILDEKVGLLPSNKPRTDLIRFVKDRPGHDRRYAIDATKIRQELGWQPSVNFDEGIRATVGWYLDNADWVSAVRDGSYRNYYESMYRERLNVYETCNA